MSDTIDCWKPWLALAEEAPRPVRKNLGSSLFLGSRLGGDGREIFQGDGHGNQLVAVAINDAVARRLIASVAEWQPIETAPTGDNDFYLVCGVGDERHPFVVRGSILKTARGPRTPEHLTMNWLTHWMPLPAPPSH